MANELTEILKKANKKKLIQLAIDDTINIKGDTLTSKEIEVINDRAYKEGWGGELERATTKARDIIIISMEAKKLLYQSMYFLSEIYNNVKASEIFYAELKDIYIKDFNVKTETYDTVIKKSKKEMTKDIEDKIRLAWRYFPSIHKEFTLRDRVGVYVGLVNNAKRGTFALINSRTAGYRLYKESEVEELKAVFIGNESEAREVIDSADHLEFCMSELQEQIPNILEIIQENKMTKKWILLDAKEIKEIGGKIGKVTQFYTDKEIKEKLKNKTEENIDKDRVYKNIGEKVLSEEYLLRGATMEERAEHTRVIDNLREYIINGK